jgi:uncharacterized protein (DUF4213/DUF364 family)
MRGKEFLVDCRIEHFHGEAFTDNPQRFSGCVIDVAEMATGDTREKSVFFATLNAVMRATGAIEGTIHCSGSDAERCGDQLAKFILKKFGDVKIAHIGYQPGHVKATSDLFDTVFVTDLNYENIGKVKFGNRIVDGALNEEIIKQVDVACITGSSIVNGALFQLLDWCKTYRVHPILYGVTVKGAANLLGFEMFCPFCRNETVLPLEIY